MPSPAWLSRNIFDDVLHREDALTDALRNFLKYPPVRCALRRTLPDNVRRHVDFSSIEDVETRSSGGSSGVPDLVLRGPTFILVIEVKVGAELTCAQKTAYVDWVRGQIEGSEEKMGFVVFLVPEDYAHRAELKSCLKKARAPYRSEDPRICIPPVPITWEKFVQALESRNMSSLNELIREFHSHLSKRFKPLSKFTSEEIHVMLDRKTARKTASGIRKLMSIVAKVGERLKDVELRPGKLDPWAFGYNVTSDDPDGGTVYFGIWWPFWEKHAHPLCIAVQRENSPQSLLDAFDKYQSGGVDFEDKEDESDGRWYLVAGYDLRPDDPDGSELIGRVSKDIEDLLRRRAL